MEDVQTRDIPSPPALIAIVGSFGFARHNVKTVLKYKTG
jgi:hypothetical protein